MLSRLLLGLLAIALAAWLLFGEFHAPVDPVAEAAQGFAPRYSLDQLKLLRTDEQGQPVLALSASHADYFDDGSAELKTIVALGLSGMAAPWQLQAPRGLVPVGEQRLELLAPVTGLGRWPDGEPLRLTAADVWIDDQRKRIESSRPVAIESESRSAKAQSFSAPFNAASLQLNSVEMRYALRD